MEIVQIVLEMTIEVFMTKQDTSYKNSIVQLWG